MLAKSEKLTKSEKAQDLFKRFLKMTEPGGCFGFPSSLTASAEDKEDALKREEFINEVIGYITSEEPGSVPIEKKFELLTLTHRDVIQLAQKRMLQCTKTMNETMNASLVAIMLTEFLAEVRSASFHALHFVGVPHDVAKKALTPEEQVLPEKYGCDCEKCRAERLKAKRG